MRQFPRMLMLQYSKHGECILKEIGAAFRGEHPADLTIVCENRVKLHAHKLVLAAASPLIRTLLEDTQLSDCATTVYFPDVNATYFKFLLDFLYSGQTCITSRDVNYLHDLLLLLQIKSDNWKTTDTAILSSKCSNLRERLNSDSNGNGNGNGKQQQHPHMYCSTKLEHSYSPELDGSDEIKKCSDGSKDSDTVKEDPGSPKCSLDDNINKDIKDIDSPATSEQEAAYTDAQLQTTANKNNIPSLNPVNLSLGLRSKHENSTRKLSYTDKNIFNTDSSSFNGTESIKRKGFFFDADKDVTKSLQDPDLNNSPENYVVTPHRKRRPGFHHSSNHNQPFASSYQHSLIDELRSAKTASSPISPYMSDRKLLSPLEEGLLGSSEVLPKNRKSIENQRPRPQSPDAAALHISPQFAYQWQSTQNPAISTFSNLQAGLGSIPPIGVGGGGGGGGRESSESVDEDMQLATAEASFTGVVRAASYSNNGLAQMLGVGVGVEFEEPDELQAVAFMLSAEPRFATAAVGGRRFSVPLPLLSCDLRRLCRRVSVPLRSGEAASCTSPPLPSQIVISPTSLS
uniref:Transcription factor Ken n=1 Tax=Ceratitis capitata TaxID=7213 RepID=W8AJY1_CERCA